MEWANALKESPKKCSLKSNAASHNTTSWYTDTDGLLEYSPSRGSLCYKGPAHQKLIPGVLSPPSYVQNPATSHFLVKCKSDDITSLFRTTQWLHLNQSKSQSPHLQLFAPSLTCCGNQLTSLLFLQYTSQAPGLGCCFPKYVVGLLAYFLQLVRPVGFRPSLPKMCHFSI